MKFISKIIIPIFLIMLVTISMSHAQRNNAFSKKWGLTYNRLEFTKDLQASFSDKVANKEIRDAEMFLRRARRQIQNKRAVIANRSLNDANNAINKALRKLLKGPLKKQQQDLDNLIESAKKSVSNSENREAKNLLKSGIENKNLAHQLFRKNEFQRALKLFGQASFQIQKSIDLVKNSDRATKVLVREEAARFEQLLNETETKISSSTNSTVKNNYRQAIKLSGRAEEAEAKQEFQQAIQYYHQATRLLLRAIDLAEGNGDRTAVRAHEEVAALDELIENLKSRFKGDHQNDQFTFLGTRILQLQQNSHKALENKNYKLSLLNAQLARDLIQRILKKSQAQRNDADEILRDELVQLGVDINEIKNRAKQAGNNEALILLRFGNAAKQKGKQFLQNRNSRLARESVLAANRFLFAADRLLRNDSSEPISVSEIWQKIQKQNKEVESIRMAVKNSPKQEVRMYFNQASRMLNRARENADQGYNFVANECVEYSKILLKKCSGLLGR